MLKIGDRVSLYKGNARQFGRVVHIERRCRTTKRDYYYVSFALVEWDNGGSDMVPFENLRRD